MRPLLFLVLYRPSVTFCQLKKDNTIVIHHVTMEKVVDVFRNHGYMISAASPKVISTVPKKTINDITIVFELDITNDSTGYLFGTYDGRKIFNGMWDHSESYGGHFKGGSFQMMDEIAKSFGQPVEYLKR